MHATFLLYFILRFNSIFSLFIFIALNPYLLNLANQHHPLSIFLLSHCSFFPSLSLFPYSPICIGLTKDGSKENSDSLEEVLDILAEEGTDWFQGFFTFLYDIMSPFETLEDEETEAAAEDVAGASQTEGVQGQKTCVILGLQNQ